jgi:acyl carrier protein
MIDKQDIQKTVKDFIQQNFIFDPNIILENDESLLGEGVIDSTGVLELIGYLEKTFQLTFEDGENNRFFAEETRQALDNANGLLFPFPSNRNLIHQELLLKWVTPLLKDITLKSSPPFAF